MPELPKSINSRIEKQKITDDLAKEKKMLLELHQEKKKMQEVMDQTFKEHKAELSKLKIQVETKQ